MWLIGNKRGFSFVELMVTVIVLASGLTLVIRGYVTSASAFSTLESRLEAMSIIDTKLQEMEALAKQDNGIKVEDTNGESAGRVRNFNWEVRVTPLEKPIDEKEVDLSELLNQVEVEVNWKEREETKSEKLVTYMRNKKVE